MLFLAALIHGILIIGVTFNAVLNDEFALTGGMEFSLASRWTATLVKENDRWQIAAYHVSTNMFDNGVSDLMLKGNSLKMGGIGLVIGVLLGVVGVVLVRFCWALH